MLMKTKNTARLTRDDVLEILQEHPAFDVRQELRVKVFEPSIYVTWRAHDHGKFPRQGSHFDLQITHDVCYGLCLGLAPMFRGLGYGLMLYKMTEAIAKRAGCTRIVRTPSGHTIGGEPRANYLYRKLGYRIVCGEAIKDL